MFGSSSVLTGISWNSRVLHSLISSRSLKSYGSRYVVQMPPAESLRPGSLRNRRTRRTVNTNNVDERVGMSLPPRVNTRQIPMHSRTSDLRAGYRGQSGDRSGVEPLSERRTSVKKEEKQGARKSNVGRKRKQTKNDTRFLSYLSHQ